MRDRLKNGLNAFNSILKLMICLEMVINLFELKFFFNIEVFFYIELGPGADTGGWPLSGSRGGYRGVAPEWVHKNQKTLSHFQITFSTSLLFNNNRCRTTKSVRLICLIDKLWLKMVHGTPRGGLWGGVKGWRPSTWKIGGTSPLVKLGGQEERAGTF